MNENFCHLGWFNLGDLIQIVLIVLKLTKVINWSWVWVLSPLIFGFAIWFIIASFCITKRILFLIKFTRKIKKLIKEDDIEEDYGG